MRQFTLISVLIGLTYSLLLKKAIGDTIIAKKDAHLLPIGWRLYKKINNKNLAFNKLMYYRLINLKQNASESKLFHIILYVESLIPVLLIVCVLDIFFYDSRVNNLRGILMGVICILDLILLFAVLLFKKQNLIIYTKNKSLLSNILVYFSPIFMVLSSFYILTIMFVGLFQEIKK